MNITSKFQPGDIVWVKAQQPYKLLIVLVLIDEQNEVLYCGGRNPKEDLVVSEAQVQKDKPTLILPRDP